MKRDVEPAPVISAEEQAERQAEAQRRAATTVSSDLGASSDVPRGGHNPSAAMEEAGVKIQTRDHFSGSGVAEDSPRVNTRPV